MSSSRSGSGGRTAAGGARRLLLALVGLASVAVGAIGVFVPGLPTTVFLLIACWCFARSWPALETRLVRNRFFAPFLRSIGPGVRMSMRAKIASLVIMWVAITLSVLAIHNSFGASYVAATVVGLGFVGSVCIVAFV